MPAFLFCCLQPLTEECFVRFRCTKNVSAQTLSNLTLARSFLAACMMARAFGVCHCSFRGEIRSGSMLLFFLCCCSQPNRIGIELYPVLTRREAISPAGLPELCPFFLHIVSKSGLSTRRWSSNTLHCSVACQKFAPRVCLLQELQHKFKVLVTSGQGLGIVFWYLVEVGGCGY